MNLISDTSPQKSYQEIDSIYSYRMLPLKLGMLALKFFLKVISSHADSS